MREEGCKSRTTDEALQVGVRPRVAASPASFKPSIDSACKAVRARE
jgi:hypothetical protein